MAGVTFTKSQPVAVSFTKGGQKVRAALITLGWTPGNGVQMDLDASLLLLNGQNKVVSQDDGWIGYWTLTRTDDGKTVRRIPPELSGSAWSDKGHPCTPDLAVIHSGDDPTGADGESITVAYDLVPDQCVKMICVVSIDQAIERKQNFGGVSGATVKITDADTGELLAECEDLSSEMTDETVAVYCQLTRDPNNFGAWFVKVVGLGYANGLEGLADTYGLAHN